MKCDKCNGTGVIVRDGEPCNISCPNCDHGNLQLRLDHNFQPVADEPTNSISEFAEAWAKDNPHVPPPLQGIQHAKNWKPTTEWPKVPLKMEAPTAVQDRDAAIAQVHAEFAKAGLCIVPVESLKQAIDKLHDARETAEDANSQEAAREFNEIAGELAGHLPKE